MYKISNSNILSECSTLQNPEIRQSLVRRKCCHPKECDGFTAISVCFFVLTFAVTCSLVIQIHFGSSEVTPHGAVASDNRLCSEIGVNFMRKEGTAVDAVIASLLCLSVMHPHHVGPGGGGVMLIYDHRLNRSKIFDFMVKTPPGGKVGVPGFLKGLEKVHKLYGKLPWKMLFEPAINLARQGFNVSRELSKALSEVSGSRFSTNFRSEFYPQGLAPMPGRILVRKRFAQFLQDVSIGAGAELYRSKYVDEIMGAFDTLQQNFTIHDLQQYQVKERLPLFGRVKNVTLATAGPPFGGLQTLSGLRLLNSRALSSFTGPNKLYLAFAEGLRLGTELTRSLGTFEDNANSTLEAEVAAADLLWKAELSPQPNFTAFSLEEDPSQKPLRPFVAEEGAASQVSAVDTFDLYVAAVVGLGDTFGSGFMTKHGIIMNGGEDTPSTPGFEQSRLSSFTPLLAVDSNNPTSRHGPLFPGSHSMIKSALPRQICGQRVVLSSGSWSAMLQTLTQLVLRNLDLTSAIVEPRIALGVSPTDLLLNDLDPRVSRLPTSVREFLKEEQGFRLKHLHVPLVVNGVSKKADALRSHSDIAGGGFAARLGINIPPSVPDPDVNARNHTSNPEARVLNLFLKRSNQ